MTDKSYSFELDFAYDDVSQGLSEITRSGKEVMSVFLKMADQIAVSTTKIGTAGKVAVDPLTAVGKAAEQVFKGVTKNLADIERLVRQSDMSPMLKQADKYGESIRKAQGELTGLYLALQNVNTSEEQRLKITNKIADTQSQIARLQQAQGKVLDMASAADSGKQLKAVLSDVEKVLNNVNKDIQSINKSTSQMGMSALEKQAADYAQRIADASSQAAQLEAQLKSVNLTQEQRIQTESRLLELRRQISVLEQTQSKGMNAAAAAEAQAKAAEQEAQNIKEATQQAKSFEKAMQQVDAVFESVDQSIKGMNQELRQSGMSGWQKQADHFAESIKSANSDVHQLQQTLKNVNLTQEQREQIEQRIAQIVQQISVLSQKQIDVNSLTRLKETTKAAEVQARSAATAYKDLGSAVVSAAGEVRNISGMLAATLTVGIGSSGKAIMDLSDNTATFRAVANATTKDVDRLVSTAKELEGIKVSAATRAAVELTRAGLSAQEATKNLGLFSKASIATGEAMDSVSKIILSTNRAYGLANSELTKTADILTRAANVSATSISEVGAGMSIMASTAKSANQDLLSTATVFGVLRDAGVSTEMAATGYKNALQDMRAPLKKTREAMDELFQTTDATNKVFTDNGKVRDFMAIMKDLKAQLSGFSDIDQGKILQRMFDERALNVIQTYLAQTEEKINANAEAMADYQGDVERTAKIMKESLGFEFRELLKDLEVLQLEFGDKIAPTLRDFIGILKDLLNAWDGLSEPMKDVIAKGVLFTAGAATLISFLSQMAIGIGGLVFAYATLKGATIQAVVQNTLVAGSNTVTGASFTALAGTIRAAALTISGPFGLALAAIVIGLGAVINEVDKLNKDLETLDENLNTYYDARAQTSGGLNAVLRLEKEGKVATPEQNRKGASDAALLAAGLDKTIEDVNDAWDGIQDINEELQKGLTGAALNELMALKNEYIATLKENGIETKEQLDDWISKNEARLSQLNQKKDKIQTNLDDQKAPKAETEPPPTKTLPDGGADDKAVDELDSFVSALENSTKRLIEDDKKAILKMKEFTDTATVKTVEAKDIYQAFLGAQPMTHIRGVKGNHAGVDLQPAADYEKAYGSQVYAPEKMKVTAVNSDLDYGAMVEFQSLVDKRIKYILHHLSPGDVKKNIQVGQEFDSGDALKVRVGGKAEIKKGPHWEGVHLHVEKYIDGKLDSIDNDKNRKTNLKTSGGQSKQELEARKKELETQKVEARLQEELNKLYTKRNEIKAKYGEQSKAYEKIIGIIDTKETELEKVKTGGLEARQKLEKERQEAIQKANERIEQLAAEHQNALINLMEESQAKIEAERQAELDKNEADRDEELRKFGGTKEQANQLNEAYDQRALDINAKHNKAKIELDEQYARESRALSDEVALARAEAMQDGLDKELALVDVGLKKRLADIDDAQKELEKSGRKDSQAWQNNEALKTQATADAEKERLRLRREFALESALAQKQAFESQLTDNQRAFESALDDLAKAQEKKGVKPFSKAAMSSLNPEDWIGLMDNLGQGSLDGLAANLKQRVTGTEKVIAALIDSQKDLEPNGLKYLEVEEKITAEKKEQARLQIAVSALSNPGLVKQLKAYQEMLPIIENINKSSAQFQTVVGAISTTLQSFVGMFGEAGRSMASGIALAENALVSVQKVAASIQKMPKNSTVSDFFKDVSNIGDVVGLVTTAIGLVGQLVTGLIKAKEETRRAVREAVNGQYEYQENQRLIELQKVIDEKKRKGLDTTAEEKEFAEAKGQNELSALSRKERKNPFTFSPDEQGRELLLEMIYSVNDKLQDDKKSVFKDSLLEKKAELMKTLEEFDAIIANKDKTLADLSAASLDKKEKATKEHEQRVLELRVQQSQLAQDKIAEIEAKREFDRAGLQSKFETDKETLTASGLEGDEFAKAEKSLAAKLASDLKKIDFDAKMEKAQANSEAWRKELEMQANHQNAQIELMQEGAAKEIAQLKANRKQRLGEMNADKEDYRWAHDEYQSIVADRDVHAKGTEAWNFINDMLIPLEFYNSEYVRLTNERRDFEKSSGQDIKDREAEIQKARTQQIADMTRQTVLMRAKLTKDTFDDIKAQGAIDFADLLKQEDDALKQARLDHIGTEEELQQTLTTIRLFYAQKRINAEQDLEKQSAESVKAKFEEQQQRQLDRKLRPLQKILDAENKTLETLRRQNEEYERSLQLIDERYSKLQTDFDASDKTQFNAGVSAVDIAAELEKGIKHLANEDIINGTVTDRSSVESQVRGLKMLLDKEAKDAESSLKLEDITKSQYLDEMTSITLRRARALQEARDNAKNADEQTDLQAEYADAYVKYQELQKESIDERRKAERKSKEELVSSNNQLIASSEYTVKRTTEQMDDLKTEFENGAKSLDDAFKKAGNSTDALIKKLEAISPTLAAQAKSSIASIKSIWDALQSPTGASSATGSTGSSTPYYNSDGTSIPVSQIPSSGTKSGEFVVQGSDGNWYRTSTEATRKIRGYKEGGVPLPNGSLRVPDLPAYANDGAIVRVGAGERILQDQFNRRLENMLTYFDVMPKTGVTVDNSVHFGDVSSNVDLDRLQKMIDTKQRRRSADSVKKWGINSTSRN